MPRFSYDLAFSRNIGWLAEWEQQALRGKRVAIAGMGGVGGVHLLTLARLGVGAFHIADFDSFDLVNFNRQIGATMDTLGRPKAEVLAGMARAINPDLFLRSFPEGVNEANLDAFLEGVDLFVDGLDFFVLGIRRRVFARCAELGIPAVTAAPIGMGVGFLAFVPGGMSFEEYFRLEGQPETEQYLRFLMGVAPRGLHRAYLVDPSRIDLAGRQGPSTGAACQLCAGVVGVAAVKLLLRRGGLKPAPWHHHYDAYLDRHVVTKLPFGAAGPVQGLKRRLARRMLARMRRPGAPRPAEFVPRTPLEEILNVARWSASGDNEQPWAFHITGEESVTLRMRPPSPDNVYEYREGEPLLLAGGMLVESLRVVASGWGRRAEWRVAEEEGRHVVHMRFLPAPDVELDPLYASVPLRSVDRRPYRRRPLTAREKAALAAAVEGGLRLEWHEGRGALWRFARLSAQATDIRLRSPEAFRTHQRVIDWERPRSPSGIPAGAIGLARATLGPMRWSMQAWRRTRLMNRMGGTATAALQLDYLPALGSAAFFTLRAKEAPGVGRAERLIEAGRDVQRFWLTATRLGLAIQPALAVLIFAHYGEHGIPFSADPALLAKSRRLAEAFRAVTGAGTGEYVFLGRIGEPYPRLPIVRSTRRSLPELIERDDRAPTEPS